MTIGTIAAPASWLYRTIVEPTWAQNIQDTLNYLYASGRLLGTASSPVGTPLVETWDWVASGGATADFGGLGRWHITSAPATSPVVQTEWFGTGLNPGLIVTAGTGAADCTTVHDKVNAGSNGIKITSSNSLVFDFRGGLSGAGANNTTARFGFGAVAANPFGNNRVCFRRASADANWQTETDLAGTTTVNDTGIAAVGSYPSNGNRFTIIATSTSVDFYIDGVKKTTHTTNIPTVVLNRKIECLRTAGGATVQVCVGPMILGVF